VSLAFSLSFRHAERTLTDAEIAEVMAAVAAAVSAAGWVVR
jgi:phenylalanyl-tRNA synthetase beta subunit